MRVTKSALLSLLLASASTLAAQSQPASQPAAPAAPAAQATAAAPTTMEQVVNHIISREQAVMQSMHQYKPLVETYIQNLRPDSELGAVPAGDKYFLGRADLTSGVEVRSLSGRTGRFHSMMSRMGGMFSFSMEYLPAGFLQMIYLDNDGFNRQNYNFEYVRREFLGEVRCLVFDVTPQPKAGKGRFLGRIWVEDQDYTIVRFNGAYSGNSKSKFYFHFDSWRVNAGPNLWLPAYVYSEESNMPYALWKHLQFKAQTRLWGYNLGPAGRESELSKVLVEAATPVSDQTETSKDLSPLQAQRAWDRQAEDNVVERMERIGLLAPRSDVDKVLDTVVNNLEVTNNLDIQPEVRCRVLLTSTLESFTIGHTIVLSRGLIDVLPDEATLATMIAHELGHVVLGHRIDTQYAFNDRLLFKDEETFQHFVFSRNEAEEAAASQKALELLKNSPYKEMGNTAKFIQALNARAKQVPNLISPHLGDRVPTGAFLTAAETSPAPASDAKDTKGAKPAPVIAALPLGSRVKVDPWSDRTEMLKAKPGGLVSEREKMPFEVTPFMLYLTRQSSLPSSSAVTAESKPDPNKKPD
jgi:hypothetical protein